MDEKKSWIRRQAPATIFGVLFIGLIGSSLYDLLVKPGLSGIGRVALDLATLGSTKVRDSAYASAALDPTPLSALVMLSFGLGLALFPLLKVLKRSRRDVKQESEVERLSTSHLPDSKHGREATMQALHRKLRGAKATFYVCFGVWYVIIATALMLHSQAVLVWRVFHANVAILTPAISSAQRDDLLAKFAAMETRAQYVAIDREMQQLAKQHAVQLKEVETW